MNSYRPDTTFYVYKITYPDGKIYVGVDWGRGCSVVTYMGSPTDIDKNFWHLCKVGETITIKKEILWTGDNKDAAQAKEREFIAKFDSTNPNFGYNKR